MTVPFQAFGASHLLVLAVTLVALAMLLRARWRGHVWARGAELALGWALFGCHFLAVFIWWQMGIGLSWERVLPMHLCNWAGFAVWVALVFRKPLAVELSWFWAFTGTIQGLLTPNQEYDWPNPTFLSFFLLHAGVIIGAVHVVFGMGMRPRRGAWWRGILYTQGYVLAATVVNLATGANYAFLREKPARASLLDHLGPWPWYVLWIHLIGVALIILLDMPFWKDRRRAARDAQA